MSDKAILFDASRCTACGACAQACKERAGLPWGTVEGNGAVADAYQRAADLDGLSPLVITLTEREASGQGMVWEVARKGCVRCAEAPCARARRGGRFDGSGGRALCELRPLRHGVSRGGAPQRR